MCQDPGKGRTGNIRGEAGGYDGQETGRDLEVRWKPEAEWRKNGFVMKEGDNIWQIERELLRLLEGRNCVRHMPGILPCLRSHRSHGEGGVTEDGVPKATTGNEISLYNELLKKNISGHMYPVEDETTCRYSGILDKGELTGKEISEMGLYDSDGDLIAYRTFLRKGKDEDIPLIFDMDEVF